LLEKFVNTVIGLVFYTLSKGSARQAVLRILAARETDHDPVPFLDHVEILDCPADVPAQALVQLVEVNLLVDG